MSTFFGISSDAASSLFSSLNSTTNNNTSSLLGDYASIKNGSYGKLLKNYYSQETKDRTTEEASNKDTVANKKKLTLLKNDATELYKSSQKLISSSMNDEEESVKNVKAFVNAYNDMIDSTVDSESKTVNRNIEAIINATAQNSDILSNVGITVDSDNKMSLDEDEFKNSKQADLKTLFKGESSFLSGIISRTSNIYTNTVSELNKTSGYDSTGKYNNVDTIGNLYNTLF